MKKLFTLLTFSILTLGLNAQHGYVYTHHGQGSDYGYNDHYHNTGNTDYGYNYNRNDRRNRGSRLDHMTRKDRKRIRKLERKLADEKRCAWEDGYLSRRDRKRIRAIQRDIDYIWSKYDRRNRGYQYNYRGRSCR